MLLEGNHIKLRALEPEDLEYIYKWENNANIWRFGDTITPFSQYILKQYLKESYKDLFEAKQLRLMIISKSINKPVGTIDVFNFDPYHNRAGVGILIEDEQQQKGFAKEAIQLLCDYCLGFLHMNQLYCHITVDNEKSIRLFETCGFEESGTLKKWNKGIDSYRDVKIYQRFKQ